MIREQPEADFVLTVGRVLTSMWIVSSPTISFHALTCFNSCPVAFTVCLVSSTSTPDGGVIKSAPDCSPNHGATDQTTRHSHESIAPPALDSVLGARTTSAWPTAGR